MVTARKIGCLLLLMGAGCTAGARRPDTGPPAAFDTDLVLEQLRRKTDATQSFRCKGTFLLQTESEKHFIHFQTLYRRPRRLRVDLDLDGPLGWGAGRMTMIERGDTLVVLPPDEEEAIRGTAESEDLRFLEPYGLHLADGAYLFAPYSGDREVLRDDRTVAAGVDARTARYRIVQRREDGKREVLLIDPTTLDLTERRIVRPGGEVLLSCTYRFNEDVSPLFAREVESRIPGEGTVLRARFREIEKNVALANDDFRDPLPCP